MSGTGAQSRLRHFRLRTIVPCFALSADLHGKGLTGERQKGVDAGDNRFGFTLYPRGLTHADQGFLMQRAVRIRVVYQMQRLGEILWWSARRSDLIAELAGFVGARRRVIADARAEYPDVIDAITELLADAIELRDGTAIGEQDGAEWRQLLDRQIGQPFLVAHRADSWRPARQ